MALNTVLVLASLTFATVGQDPSLDTQIVTPVLNEQSAQAGTTAPAQSKITVQFRDAKASEVFTWLENRGVNFVVSQGDIAKDARVTLNMQDVSLDSALDSIARALGGHWEREEGVRVFKKGEAPFRYFATPGALPGGRLAPQGPSGAPKLWVPTPGAPGAKGFMPAMPAIPPFPKGEFPLPPDVKVWKFDGDMSPEQRKAFEKQFGPDFQKKMELWSKEFEKNFGPEFEERMRKMSAEMESKLGENSDFAKQMRELEKQQGAIALGADGKMLKLDRKQIENMRREALAEGQRARAEGARARAEGARARAEGARARAEGERARVEAQRMRVRIQGDAKAGDLKGKVFVMPRGEVREFYVPGRSGGGELHFLRGGDGSGTVDIKRFLRSLTPDQKDRQRKRGFIWWNDLTREQKEMLGGQPDGKFEIRYKINDDEITIRGN